MSTNDSASQRKNLIVGASKLTGFVDPKSTRMDKEYDKIYPVSNHDYLRKCANLIPAHINLKDKIIIRYVECGEVYRQWNRLQDNEAWSYCWLCADKITNPKKYKKKK